MKKEIERYLITAIMLIGLPMAGAVAAGKPVRLFLEFPPLSRYVIHADFSWPVFFGIALTDIFLLVLVLELVRRGKPSTLPVVSEKRGSFPWWGWAGGLLCVIGWILAWTRFGWFVLFQRHTFTIPWLGYILVVNGLCRKKTSRCLLTDRPLRFLLLFPFSAFFWWFFEYLNRYVQNWYYLGVADFDPIAYFFFASLSFSTVLPAVISTNELLLTRPILNAGLSMRRPIRITKSKPIAVAAFTMAACGLALIGVYPDYLFPLLWVSPLLILTSLQTLYKENNMFTPLFHGDFRSLVVPPLAALACGVLWEMWNIHSLAKWEYAIPFVDRFPIFEMPLLGYGGYLPFGLECLMIGRIILGED